MSVKSIYTKFYLSLTLVFLFLFLSSIFASHAYAQSGCPLKPQGTQDATGHCVKVNPSDVGSPLLSSGVCCSTPGGCPDCAGVACTVSQSGADSCRSYGNYVCSAPGSGGTGTCSWCDDPFVCRLKIQNSQTAWKRMWNDQTSRQWQYNAYLQGSDFTKTGAEGIAAMNGNGVINSLAASGYKDPWIIAQAKAQGITLDPGAVNYLASGIGSMMGQKPAQTATYIADLGKQAGIYNPVYADDGTGFTALQPILKIWKAFRNMAYLMFVFVFVIIGFMIMFRSKINQQTVISIQLALPQIITTLLLITFSYAIAAFMIDLIYFLIYLIVAVFQTFGILEAGSQPPARDILLNKSLLGIAFENLITPGDTIGQASRAVGTFMEGAINADIIDEIVGGISSALAYLIFVVAVLIAVFKLFFQLLISYIGLIVSTIFAPIILMFNAMPGSQSFSKWLKGIFANALVFPVAALLLLLSAVLTGEFDFGVASDVGFNGSQGKYSQIALPLIGGGMDTNAIKAFIGIGLLMMMPKVIELVQKALGVEGGIGGMMGAIMEPIQAGYGKTVGAGVNAGVGEAKYQASRRLADWSNNAGNNKGLSTGGARGWLGRQYVRRRQHQVGFDVKDKDVD